MSEATEANLAPLRVNAEPLPPGIDRTIWDGVVESEFFPGLFAYGKVGLAWGKHPDVQLAVVDDTMDVAAAAMLDLDRVICGTPEAIRERVEGRVVVLFQPPLTPIAAFRAKYAAVFEVAAAISIAQIPGDGLYQSKTLNELTPEALAKEIKRAERAYSNLANCPPVQGAPVVICMADVKPRPVNWLWHGRIPAGRLTLLAGRPGEGKSMATMDWAARVTRGTPWPDGSTCPVGSVVLVAGEDDPEETIRPRLDAHGADCKRVSMLQAVVRINAKGVAHEAAFTLADIEPLRLTLARLPDCALVIIDPIGSFVGGKVDAHRDNEVRAVLAPLGALARETGAAVLIVAHLRKGSGSNADDLVMGSRAFTGMARSVLHLMLDPADNQRRLLLPGKNNLAEPPAGLAFAISGEPACITWEHDPVTMTANDVLAAQNGGDRSDGCNGDRRSKRDEAADWLRGHLADGPKLGSEVLAEAKADGFSARTLERARATAGVRPVKIGYESGWYWQSDPAGEVRPTGLEGRQTTDGGGLRVNPAESCGNGSKAAKPVNVAALGGLDAVLGGNRQGAR